jgi:tetratricopeptide (TPR) repeat protein
MANAHADLGQYEEAIEGYKHAIRLSLKLSKPRLP